MRSTELSTRTKSPQRKLQEGQAIVLIGLLILVLFAMLGLAIDSGRSYVDRRDQQAAVDAAALAAGDWYENYRDLPNYAVPHSVVVYQNDLHFYGAVPTVIPIHGLVGPLGNLDQYTYNYTYPGGYSLQLIATNTQFNGYQFSFSSTHNLALAFMQIFGGPTTAFITATATAIVGNQRQTPALLTLATSAQIACSVQLQGAGQLTVLGDVYSNGAACLDANMHEAGNCYASTGNCSVAQFYCYNSTPGFIPYPPPCAGGDVQGGPIVPAPTLPDPNYLAGSVPYYPGIGAQLNRGGYTEMTPGSYNNFSISGGGCYWLDPGVYTWNGGYTSHGGLTSNELKAPQEEYWNGAGSTALADGSAPHPPSFWGGCSGTFNVTVVPAGGGNGMKHQSGLGNWGIELTSVRYDRFLDPTVLPDPCLAVPGCRRESAPSACQQVNTADISNQGIDVNITQNAPGAQYYAVYIDPNGCEASPANRSNFSYVGDFLAPGWTDGGGPPATGTGVPSWTGTLTGARNPAGTFWACAAPGVTICQIAYNNLNTPASTCQSQARAQNCTAPDDETAPQCFATCPAAATVPQSNNTMSLEWAPNTGGDVANENYCQVTPPSGTGDPAAACATAKITPGAVQFYFPAGACLDQNGNGSTHVFSGEQYNWIVIFQPPANNCSFQKLNGNANTQYIGSIYSPAASWDILGSDTSPLAGQVICFAAKVTGSANVGIDFNPNYSPAPPAARLIN
ncbi:MAG TPA: pilus assembly protein TadG-related protein [Candidatus Dormibacteraeota bacterium]